MTLYEEGVTGKATHVRQLHHAIVLAAAADVDEVDYAYGEAVAEGAMSTLGCPSCERAHGTLWLLTLALMLLPELAVQAHLIDVNDAAPGGILDLILERTCATSAFTIGTTEWFVISRTSSTTRGSSRPFSARAITASGMKLASPQMEPAAPAAQARPR